MSPASLVSVIVPTLREAEGLPHVARGIADALAGRAFEIVVVDDDSRDGTPAVCHALIHDEGLPLRLLTRTDPRDGLGGAVIHGLRSAHGDVLVVMDADGQHPPACLPSLLAPIERGEADFVVGSRYVPGAGTTKRWTPGRRINSLVATWLARPFAGKLADPMSGFFALPRSTLARGLGLAPLGYKVGLELLCKCSVRKVAEVPIYFDARQFGRSKLTLRERFRYLEHLSRLYDFRFTRKSAAAKFLTVVALGWLVGTAAFVAAAWQGWPAVAAATLAYAGVSLTAATFHLRYCRTQRDFLARPTPWRDFSASAAVELAVAAGVAAYLAGRLATPTVAELLVLPLFAATVVRYVLRKELKLDVRGQRPEVPEVRTLRLRPAEPLRRAA